MNITEAYTEPDSLIGMEFSWGEYRCTIVDYYTTKNSRGELIKTEYKNQVEYTNGEIGYFIETISEIIDSLSPLDFDRLMYRDHETGDAYWRPSKGE